MDANQQRFSVDPSEFSKNMSDNERLLSVLVAVVAGMISFKQGWRRWNGRALMGLAGFVLARGASGYCPVYQAFGIDRGMQPRATSSSWRSDAEKVRIEKQVTINRPREEVYAFWSDINNWPLAIPHLQAVSITGPGRFQWSLKGPTGATLTWDAAITENRTNERIAWRSLSRIGANNHGSVKFHSLDAGSTVVTLVIEYSPTGGAVGRVTSNLLGQDPEHRIGEQLQAFKERMERTDVKASP